MERKKCSKCQTEKELSEFYKNKAKSDGFSWWCKTCKNNHVTNNPQYNKKYRQNNREKTREWDNQYRQNNREKYNKYQGEYRKNKWKNDPLWNLSMRVRCRTSTVFKNMGYKKNDNTEKIIGIHWEGLKEHIEKQFTKGMNWDNRSEWHIDHIIPLASAKTEDELIKLCHYTNLQPLWATDNLRKGKKIYNT